ncbi:MAG: hypothetical protein SOX32_13475 [Candidatus Choladocola sp.]|nr:hypothetical protein [Candidatus Choladocola sp.]
MIFTGSLFQLSHIQFFFDNFRSAISGVEWFVAVYIVCILCFFIVGKQYLNTAFVYPLAFMAVTVFNPFLIVPLSEVIGLTTRIRRLFWLLPVNLVLAFSFTWLCTRPGRQLLKIGAAVCCIGFIVTAGTSVRPYLRMPQNIYKTSDIILEISGIIDEDSRATGTEKSALYSSQQLLELRQYDASIKSVLRRSDLLDWSLPDTSEETIQKAAQSGHIPHTMALVSRYGVQIDQDRFLEFARICHAYYVITNVDMNLSDYLSTAGYDLIGTAGDFEIYRILPENLPQKESE